MSAPAAEELVGRADARDVLTADEESVLSSLRGIVVALRSGVAGVRLADVERALIAEGGVPLESEAMPGTNAFVLRGACFSIASASGCAGAIEVDFIHVSP